MLIDLRSKDLNGKLAEETLIKADITVNKNMVPFDTQSPLVTSGIRIGAPAITTRGFMENDSVKTVEWIDKILTNHDNDAVISKVKSEINEYMQDFPLFKSDESELIVNGIGH
jgi:glycine hydroxymethyltransferase